MSTIDDISRITGPSIRLAHASSGIEECVMAMETYIRAGIIEDTEPSGEFEDRLNAIIAETKDEKYNNIAQREIHEHWDGRDDENGLMHVAVSTLAKHIPIIVIGLVALETLETTAELSKAYALAMGTVDDCSDILYGENVAGEYIAEHLPVTGGLLDECFALMDDVTEAIGNREFDYAAIQAQGEKLFAHERRDSPVAQMRSMIEEATRPEASC